jgi:class 3 adenylate cyclase
MARLKTSERKDLPDSAFAYIDAKGRRRLPINDEAHVRNALSRFERVAFEDDGARERARIRLLKAAKRYGIVPVGFITGQLRSERAARPADRKMLPTGSVTLLMTDIEGSTELLRRLGGRYSSVLSETRRVLRRAVRASGGHEVDAHADEYFASFERAPAALNAALAIQRMLGEHTWPAGIDVRVRVGIHGGRPTLTDTGYVGLSVHTVARICSAAHGGQILVSDRTRRAVKGSIPTGVRLRSLGRHPLPGLPKDEALFQVEAKGLPTDFPPLRIDPQAASPAPR